MEYMGSELESTESGDKWSAWGGDMRTTGKGGLRRIGVMMVKAWLLAGVVWSTCVAAGTGEVTDGWSRIGSTDQVMIGQGGEIALKVMEPATAGAVSEARGLVAGADAVLVKARIGGADVRSVTIGMQGGKEGQTVGYWQNLNSLTEPAEVAALLPLDWRMMGREKGRVGESVRLFVGTDQRPSGATIEGLKWEFARRGAGAAGGIWACAVDGSHHPSQSFIAKGKLTAVVLRMRFAGEEQSGREAGGTGLMLNVYAWRENVAQTRQSKPVGTGRLAAEVIPAGVEGNERDVTMAVDAQTVAGKKYLLEIVPGGNEGGRKVFLWGGPDQYEAGECYDMNRLKTGWDLYFQTYYRAE